MEKMYGEGVDGKYWLSQMQIPRSVSNLMVFDALGLNREEQEVEVRIGDEALKALRVPAIDIGYSSKDEVDSAILTSMGYFS